MEKSEFEKLFAIVPDMVCIANTDGYFEYLNPAWEKKLGHSLNELRSRPLFEFVHPDDHERTRKEIERQKKGEKTFAFTNRYRCKDGSYKTLEWNATAAEGSRLFAVARDITERKKKTDILIRSENRLRSVLEKLEMIAVCLDADGEIEFCNDYLLDLTGWKREEVLGKDWFTVFLPHDIKDQIKQSVFQKTIQTGNFPAHYQNEIVTKTGERRVINWSNTAYRDPRGNILNITSIGEDITARIHAENDLKRSITRYRQIFYTTKVSRFYFGAQALRTFASE